MCKDGNCAAFDKVATVLAKAGTDADLTALNADMDTFIKTTKAKMKKLMAAKTRALEDALESAEEEKQAFWRKIERTAKRKGLLPADYTRDSYGLGFSPDGDLTIAKVADITKLRISEMLKGGGEEGGNLDVDGINMDEVPDDVRALIAQAQKMGAQIAVRGLPGGKGMMEALIHGKKKASGPLPNNVIGFGPRKGDV